MACPLAAVDQAVGAGDLVRGAAAHGLALRKTLTCAQAPAAERGVLRRRRADSDDDGDDSSHEADARPPVCVTLEALSGRARALSQRLLSPSRARKTPSHTRPLSALLAVPPHALPPPALEHALQAVERALAAADGDTAAVEALLRDGAAFADAYGIHLGERPLMDACVICAAPCGVIPWSCRHYTCIECTEHAASAYSKLRLAPQLGPGAVLPSVVPCPATGGNAACRGVLPSLTHGTYLENHSRNELATANLFELAAAAGPNWRACDGPSCGLFVRTRADEASARCICSHRTCLQGGSVATNCDGGAHEGLSCAAARAVRAVVAAAAPAMQASAEAAVAAAAAEQQVAALRYDAMRAAAMEERRVRYAEARPVAVQAPDLSAAQAEPRLAAALPQLPGAREVPPLGQPEALFEATEARLAMAPSRDERRARAHAAASAQAAACLQKARAVVAEAGPLVASLAAALVNARLLLRWMRTAAAAAAAAPDEQAAAAAAAAAEAEVSAICADLQVREAAAREGAGAEALSDAYLVAHTRPCPTPGCGRQLQKSDIGCNALEPCPTCQRACCWSCLGPVHNHSVGPCDRSGDYNALMAVLAAAGAGARAPAVAAAMAAADAASAAARDHRLPARDAEMRVLERADAALAAAAAPSREEAMLAPLRAQLRLARLEEGAAREEAAATLRAMMLLLEHNCASGARDWRWLAGGAAAAAHAGPWAADAEARRFVEGDLALMRREEEEAMRRREPPPPPPPRPPRAHPLSSARFGVSTRPADQARDHALLAAALRAAEAAAPLRAAEAAAPGGGDRSPAARLLAAVHALGRRAALFSERMAQHREDAELSAAFRALRHASEDDAVTRIALLACALPVAGVCAPPALPEAAAAALVARADALGAAADALEADAWLLAGVHRPRDGAPPPPRAAVRAAAAALVRAADELTRVGPESLLALSGGVAAMRPPE